MMIDSLSSWQQDSEKRTRVFVSSTYADLIEERRETIRLILSLDWLPVGMELIPASGDPWEYTKHLIDISDYFLLIIGERYGAIRTNDSGEKASYTELEYDYAVKTDKPILAFIQKSKKKLPNANNENNRIDIKKLDDFTKKVSEKNRAIYWSNKGDLSSRIFSSLSTLLEDDPTSIVDARTSKSFEKAETPNEVIEALENRALLAQNTHEGAVKYVYHYTKMSAVSDILKGKKWYVGSPKNMNDGLELIHLEDVHADNLFFASFCMGNSENIGMWSMYAQPWEEGVILRIPIEKMKAWVKSGCKIYDADKDTKAAGAEIKDARIAFHAVAYINEDSNETRTVDILSCGKDTNDYLGKISEQPLQNILKGYLKDNAWAYENEYRIRVETDPREKHDAVSIDIPKDVLDSFEFITGPRFKKNFIEVLRKKAGPRLNPKVTASLFTGRLNWIYCDSCNFKKKSTAKE